MLTIILLSIVLPISFIVFSIGLYIGLKAIYLNKYSRYLNDLEQFLEYEPYVETLTLIRTMDISLQKQEKKLYDKLTSASNDEIKINDVKINNINASKEIFASQQIEVEDSIAKITKLKDKLLDLLNSSKVFSCKSIIKEIEKIKKDTNIIKEKVEQATKEFIDPINDFEHQKFKLGKIVQEMNKLSIIWKNEIVSDVFDSNVDDKFLKINNCLIEAENSLSMRDKDNTFKYFSQYKKNIYDLLNFANHYDKFKEILTTTSSKSYKNVLDYIDRVKSITKHNYDELNIPSYLNNINEFLIKAKEYFYDFNISKIEENIKNYYDTLLALTFLMSQEIKAHSFLEQNGLDLINEIYVNAAEKYKQIQISIENILQIDKMFYWNLLTSINEAQEMLNNVNSYIELYKEDETNNSLFSKRVTKYKNIVSTLQVFYVECENIEKSIDIFYTEGISQGLRYNKLKKIYIKSYSDIKKYNIQLSIEDNENITNLEKEKSDIETYIMSHDNYNEKDLKNHVDNFQSLIINFINSSFKKVLIMKTFTLINTKYSYIRTKNVLYNKKVIESESLIADGKYYDGLSYLINAIKGVNN